MREWEGKNSPVLGGRLANERRGAGERGYEDCDLHSSSPILLSPREVVSIVEMIFGGRWGGVRKIERKDE
jgi:hypothetical protein